MVRVGQWHNWLSMVFHCLQFTWKAEDPPLHYALYTFAFLWRRMDANWVAGMQKKCKNVRRWSHLKVNWNWLIPLAGIKRAFSMSIFDQSISTTINLTNREMLRINRQKYAECFHIQNSQNSQSIENSPRWYWNLFWRWNYEERLSLRKQAHGNMDFFGKERECMSCFSFYLTFLECRTNQAGDSYSVSRLPFIAWLVWETPFFF